MTALRMAVVHQEVGQDSPPDELDILSQVETICSALEDLGYETLIMPCSLDLESMASRLRTWRPDLIFNLVESLAGRCRLLSLFPEMLDTMGVPYTGSKAETLRATTHKVWAKRCLQGAGIPTPAWLGPYPDEVTSRRHQSAGSHNRANGPWIIKSLWEHASLGLDDDGLINAGDERSIYQALKERRISLGGACFAEEFIPGREFNLSLLEGPGGPQVLAPAEILFEGYGSDRLQIVGYRAKWDPGSYEYHHTPRNFEFPEEDFPLLAQLKETALQCWHLMDVRGYARVDFRVDEQQQPWVLEINANPCLSPEAGYAAALAQSGISFQEAMKRIVGAAMKDSALK